MNATSRKSEERSTVVIAAAAFFSLGMLAIAVFLVTRILGYSSLDAETTGTVTAEDSSTSKGSTECSSDVTYAVGGVDRELVYGSCPGVGDVVTVRYEADNPDRATADGPTRTYVAYPILVVVLTLTSGLIGFIGVRFWREERARAQRKT